MENKKSVYVWIILVLFILGIIGSFWSLISGLLNIKALLTPSLLSNPTANIIRLGLHLVDLCLSLVFVYKLYNFKQDVIKWAHISFAFIIVNLFLQLILTPNLLFAVLAFIPWIVLSIITIIIWVTFVKHLKKRNINSTSIPFSVDNLTEELENGDKDKKISSFKSWIKNNKKLVIILSIIVLITIIIPVSMILSVSIGSKIKCEEGGYLNGNSNIGYNCSYDITNPEFTDVFQCVDSKTFCNSKGRDDKNGSCISGDVDLTTRLKVDENGGFYVEKSPVVCSYCCGTEIKDNIENIPNPIIDKLDMVNVKEEKVNKSVAGNFMNVNSGEIFNYIEKYSTEEWNVNTRNYNRNTVNECANLGCSFVYFGDYDKNLLMFTSLDIDQDKKQGKLALFNDRDNPLIGKIIKVVFYVNGDKISGFPSSEDRHVDVFYTISYKENGVSKTTERIEQNICNYENIDAICTPIIKKVGAEIFFFDGPEDIYLRSIFLSNKIIKTQMTNFKIINE